MNNLECIKIKSEVLTNIYDYIKEQRGYVLTTYQDMGTYTDDNGKERTKWERVEKPIEELDEYDMKKVEFLDTLMKECETKWINL